MKLNIGEKSVHIDNERGETVTLSMEDVAALATNAHNILDQLALHGSGEGQFLAAGTRTVVGTTVTLDTHATEVVLLLDFSDGTKIGYVASPKLAGELIEALAKKLREIEAVQAGRTKQ